MRRLLTLGLLGLLTGRGTLPAWTSPPAGEGIGGHTPPPTFSPAIDWSSVCLTDVSAEHQQRARAVLAKPTLHARGPVEAFRCQPETYRWLLDHPDRAVALWRRLGARTAPISNRGDGRFGWQDGQGSDIQWETVARGSRHRVWYAEGQVKPGLLLPTVPVRALLSLHFEDGQDADGHPAVRHHCELILQTDSKAAALAARLLGTSGPRLAEQYLAQIEMFYAGLAWYLDERPELFRELRSP